MNVEENEIYYPGGNATLNNEPPDAPLGSPLSSSQYYTYLWREWYSALSEVDRFDFMFQELPLQFRTVNNILCQRAIKVFDESWAKERWDIVYPPTLEEQIETNKISHKETFPDADCYKAKVSKKVVDNKSITAAQAFAEINSLVDELVYHEKKYYDDNDPEITDYDFDMKLKRLEELEEQFPEFKHSESPTERVGRENLE